MEEAQRLKRLPCLLLCQLTLQGIVSCKHTSIHDHGKRHKCESMDKLLNLLLELVRQQGPGLQACMCAERGAFPTSNYGLRPWRSAQPILDPAQISTPIATTCLLSLEVRMNLSSHPHIQMSAIVMALQPQISFWKAHGIQNCMRSILFIMSYWHASSSIQHVMTCLHLACLSSRCQKEHALLGQIRMSEAACTLHITCTCMIV